MSLDAVSLAHRWFEEVWNKGSEEAIDQLLPAHGIAHGLADGEADVRGPAEFKHFVRNMRAALPDIHIRIEDTIASGDKAVVRILLQGTHRGQGLGLAPTGRRVSIEGIVIIRTAGGQLVEGWNSWDQLGLLRQLGAIPAPQSPDRFTSAQA